MIVVVLANLSKNLWIWFVAYSIRKIFLRWVEWLVTGLQWGWIICIINSNSPLIMIDQLHVLCHIINMYLLQKNCHKTSSNKTLLILLYNLSNKISASNNLHALKFSSILTSTLILKMNFSSLYRMIFTNSFRIYWSTILKINLLDYYLLNTFYMKVMFITWGYWWKSYL